MTTAAPPGTRGRGRGAGLRSLGVAGALLAIVAATGGGVGRASHPRRPGAGVRSNVSSSFLPADLEARGRGILAETDQKTRAKLAGSLMTEEPVRAETFLLSVLDRDPSALVRRAIVNAFAGSGSVAVRRALMRHAADDPDAEVGLDSLERLRLLDTTANRKLLRRRIDAALHEGDTDALRRLLDEDERYIGLTRGVALPSFLRKPPGPFAVASESSSIHVLAFGDFGDGSVEQRETASAMRAVALKTPFDFGLTLGDNFYQEGMASPQDPRWKSWWEDLYAPLGIRFYAVMGNHDWKMSDSPAAEILYSSGTWSMPAPYYTFTAGPAQFFAVDTNEVSDAQLAWLAGALGASRARWKIVYGHHPIRSAGHHGDTADLVARLLPILRGRADIYLCGHDHDLQHLREEGGVHFFVSGGGGAGTRPLHPDPREIFGVNEHGFATLEIVPDAVTVRFVASDGRMLYNYELAK